MESEDTSKVDKESDKMEKFKVWIETHQKETEFISVYQNNSKVLPEDQFLKLRSSRMLRSIDTLKAFSDNAIRQQNILKEKMMLRKQEIEKQNPPPLFSSKRQIMVCRKLYFIENQINIMKYEALKKNYDHLEDQINTCTELLFLLMAQIIPSKVAVTINEDKLFSKFNAHDYIIHLKMMRSKADELKQLIETFNKPLWVTDLKAFIEKLIDLISEKNPGKEKYFLPHEQEVSFSRALFTIPDSEMGKQFDAFLNELAITAMNDFNKKVIPFCFSIINEKNNRRKNILFNIYYRALCNRIYERFPSLFKPQKENDLDLYYKVCNMSISDFELPQWLASQLNPKLSFRDALRAIPVIFDASDPLILTSFQVDSNSILYDFEHMMQKVQNMINAAYDRNIAKALDFEESFPIIFSVIVASDIACVFDLQDRIQILLPKSQFVPGFDLAATNMEAVTAHIKEIAQNLP